jgi:hypothetical protein
LILKEEHRLKMFENRLLRKVLRYKRDEVTGEWRRLHNEELYNLYSSPNIVKLKGWVGHVTRTGDKMNACRVLV